MMAVRKKKTAKKATGGKKTVKKKATGKKTVRKKTAGKKTGTRKKTAGKKTASKKTASKKKASPARERTVQYDGLVRLNKYLADHGVASRRRCDELITEGKVTVDDKPVNELGTRIDPTTQRVEVGGFVLKPQNATRRYYLLNKPPGVLCTNEERETRPRAVDLVTARDKGRIYTVGRLDEDSKGLILLTNDGDFANHVMHPRNGVPKTYVVRVAGRIEDDALNKVRDGVHLSEGRTGGARILVKRRTTNYSLLAVTLYEGMNREIRRAFARVGYKVLDLRRTRIGPLTDRGLKTGHWRALTNAEVRSLLHYDESAEEEQLPERGRRGRAKGGAGAQRASVRRKAFAEGSAGRPKAAFKKKVTRRKGGGRR